MRLPSATSLARMSVKRLPVLMAPAEKVPALLGG